MTNRAFIIAAFGDRSKNVQRLVKNIRSYSDLPIHILTTTDSSIKPFTDYLKINSKLRVPIDGGFYSNIHIEYVERIWPEGSYREGIRNSNYWKVKKALELADTYESMCLLDDDMYIVDKGFVEGFKIAERFGAALPLNPRVYVWANAMGADVQQKDIEEISYTPMKAPACNFSPFFVCLRITNAKIFMMNLEERLRQNVCRGTLAVWKASWQTGFTPVYLPEQWCVCGSSAQRIKVYAKLLKGKMVQIPPMMLHLGHEQVRKVFGVER